MLLLKTGRNFGDFCFYGTHFGDSHQIHQIQYFYYRGQNLAIITKSLKFPKISTRFNKVYTLQKGALEAQRLSYYQLLFGGYFVRALKEWNYPASYSESIHMPQTECWLASVDNLACEVS